jgi:hypothetical protein
MRNLQDFVFNGKEVQRMVVEASEYKSIPQAIASLTLFSHPETVAQTKCLNIFKVIRCSLMSERGKYGTLDDGTQVMLHDNTPPYEAFTWANGISRWSFTDCQFNHIWSDSKNVALYTSLANLCVLPAFLAKLTDTDNYIKEILQFRSFELYNSFSPVGIKPYRPKDYDDLIWAPTLPPIENVENQLRREMAKKRKNKTIQCARDLGWLFSSFEPDLNI